MVRGTILKKLFVLSTLISMTACYSDTTHSMSNNPSRHILVSNLFSSNQQSLIKQALDQWKDQTGMFTYDLTIVSNVDPYNIKENTTLIYPVDPNFLSSKGKDGITFWYFMDKEYYPVIISPILNDNEFLKTTIHELGHTFRLNHYYGLNQSVMFQVLQPNIGLSCSDIQDFCNLWGCETKCKTIPNDNYFPLNIGDVSSGNKELINLNEDILK